jgi:ADP-ribose pyrophosphatase
MRLQWYPIAEAVSRVFNGDIVNSLAVAGILAAFAVTNGLAQPRPVDTPWVDKSTAFAARQAAR